MWGQPRNDHILYQSILGAQKETCGDILPQVAVKCGGRVVNPLKVCTTLNRADILTNCVLEGTLGSLSNVSYGVDWGEK